MADPAATIRETAILLWAADVSDEHQNAEGALRWARQCYEQVDEHPTWANGRHEGDCTKVAMTCFRCLREAYERDAEVVLELGVSGFAVLVSRAEAADTLAAELRREFFRQLPDLDYEQIIPGCEDVEVGGPVYDWAWARHPWFALLGLTREECTAYLRASEAERARAALAVHAGTANQHTQT